MEESMSGHGIGVLLLLMLIGGLAGGEILARLLPRWGHPKGKRTVRILMLVGAAAYSGALVTASLTSRERVLARGETLKFCGFYLDCHLGVAVEGVDQRPVIGSARAEGMYHLVQIRVSSDAVRATLQLGRPTFRVIDSEGNTFSRDEAAERTLARASGDLLPLVRPVAAGESYAVQVVFDLPEGIREPRLHVTDAAGVDRVLEGILIGDDDSILHKPTTLALN
jgi:hypothetical protein